MASTGTRPTSSAAGAADAHDAHGALVARVAEGWAELAGAVWLLGRAGLDERAPDGRTYRALVAHVAAWERVAASRLAHLAATAEPAPAPDDEEAFEARAAAEWEGRAPEALLGELRAAHHALRDELAGLSPALLAAHGGWAAAVVAGSTFEHYAEHLDALRAGVPRTAEEAVARLERWWVELRGAVRGLGRAGLEREIRPGWRYAEVVAHLVGWMQQGVRELRAREHVTGWTRERIDAFNERSVQERRLVGAEALLDELDTSYRMLLAEVRTLGPDEVRDASGPLVTYTWHHWEEHLPELRG